MKRLRGTGWKVKEISAKFGISRQGYCRLMKRDVGMPYSPGAKKRILRNGRPCLYKPALAGKAAEFAKHLGAVDYVMEHLIVWAVHHDRLPPDDMDIHHKDGDVANNAPENLELLPKGHHTMATRRLHAEIAALKAKIETDGA
jgi:hypothetical protein